VQQQQQQQQQRGAAPAPINLLLAPGLPRLTPQLGGQAILWPKDSTDQQQQQQQHPNQQAAQQSGARPPSPLPTVPPTAQPLIAPSAAPLPQQVATRPPHAAGGMPRSMSLPLLGPASSPCLRQPPQLGGAAHPGLLPHHLLARPLLPLLAAPKPQGEEQPSAALLDPQSPASRHGGGGGGGGRDDVDGGGDQGVAEQQASSSTSPGPHQHHHQQQQDGEGSSSRCTTPSPNEGDHQSQRDQKLPTPPGAPHTLTAQKQQHLQQQSQLAAAASPWAQAALSPASSLHSALSTVSSSVNLSLLHTALGTASATSPTPLPSLSLQRSLSNSSLPATDGAAADAAGGDELPPGAEALQQYAWAPRLESVECRKPAPMTVPLLTPTSSDWEYYDEHKHDSMLFNVGLVADASAPQPVKLAAVDLARNSR